MGERQRASGGGWDWADWKMTDSGLLFFFFPFYINVEVRRKMEHRAEVLDVHRDIPSGPYVRRLTKISACITFTVKCAN